MPPLRPNVWIVEDYNFRATYTQLTRAIKAIADHFGVEVQLHTG